MNRRFLAAAGIGVTFLVGAAGLTFADYVGGQAALERGDTIRALEEFRRAAEAGDPRAQHRLGQFYERGDHVLQDYAIAHMWYNLAAAKGVAEAAAARDALAQRMPPEQLARAQDMARQRLAAAAPPAAGPQATPARPAAAPITTADVEMVQRRLNALGYQAGSADGIVGSRTRSAVSAWQEDVGLPQTGVIDRTVLDRLAAAASPAPPVATAAPAPAPAPAQMSQAERTRAVQGALNAAGYDAGPTDGIMGSKTRSAISAWQRAHGMPVTGEISPQLMTSLNVGGTSVAASPARPAVAAQRRGGEGDLLASGRIAPYTSEVQAELAQHGYFRGAADGQLSDTLRGAIREYEEDAGLTVTGQVSEDLLDHLKFSRPEVIKQQRAGAR